MAEKKRKIRGEIRSVLGNLFVSFLNDIRTVYR